MMYHEIHKLRREGHSVSYIADHLVINWRTVKKMLSMDQREYEMYLSTQLNRPKELAAYESFVKIKLDRFPATSASQMHDWLKEFDENFPKVNPKTVYNFDLETVNDEAFAWLSRTANYMPHGKTKTSPFDQWNIEKKYLSEFVPVKLQFDQAKAYTVRKDNVISYKSNLYSLPEGTWKGKGTQVYITVDQGQLIIKNLSGKLLRQCKISMGKGETIINNDHKRDKTSKINISDIIN